MDLEKMEKRHQMHQESVSHQAGDVTWNRQFFKLVGKVHSVTLNLLLNVFFQGVLENHLLIKWRLQNLFSKWLYVGLFQTSTVTKKSKYSLAGIGVLTLIATSFKLVKLHELNSVDGWISCRVVDVVYFIHQSQEKTRSKPFIHSLPPSQWIILFDFSTRKIWFSSFLTGNLNKAWLSAICILKGPILFIIPQSANCMSSRKILAKWLITHMSNKKKK